MRRALALSQACALPPLLLLLPPARQLVQQPASRGAPPQCCSTRPSCQCWRSPAVQHTVVIRPPSGAVCECHTLAWQARSNCWGPPGTRPPPQLEGGSRGRKKLPAAVHAGRRGREAGPGHLCEEAAADHSRLQLQVALVGGDDGAPPGHLRQLAAGGLAWLRRCRCMGMSRGSFALPRQLGVHF